MYSGAVPSLTLLHESPDKCFTCLQLDLVKNVTHRNNHEAIFFKECACICIHALRSHYMNIIKVAKNYGRNSICEY